MNRTSMMCSIGIALLASACVTENDEESAAEQIATLESELGETSVYAKFGADAEPERPLVIGGDVIRHDGIQNLIIARNLSFTPNGQGSSCDVWNKDGGSTPKFLDSHNNCTTASMNGRTYSWTVWNDTDAFTMQYEAYWVKCRDGVWKRVGANIYTRIHDNENVHCYRESDGVNCYISLG